MVPRGCRRQGGLSGSPGARITSDGILRASWESAKKIPRVEFRGSQAGRRTDRRPSRFLARTLAMDGDGGLRG